MVTLPTATPTISPTANPPTGVGVGAGPGPGTTGTGGAGSAPLSSSVALLRPDGVGLVSRLIDTASGNASANGVDPNPDAYTELLSLSIRDGLRVGAFQLWPLLAALQVLLLVAAGVFCVRRVLRASSQPGD